MINVKKIYCLKTCWGQFPFPLRLKSVKATDYEYIAQILSFGLDKNCQLSIYFKEFQWQYKEAMQFVLWVAQKKYLQA